MLLWSNCWVSGESAVLKNGHLVWKWTYPLSSDTVAKEIHLTNTEDTLGFVDNQSAGGKELEKLTEMFDVFCV